METKNLPYLSDENFIISDNKDSNLDISSIIFSFCTFHSLDFSTFSTFFLASSVFFHKSNFSALLPYFFDCIV